MRSGENQVSKKWEITMGERTSMVFLSNPPLPSHIDLHLSQCKLVSRTDNQKEQMLFQMSIFKASSITNHYPLGELALSSNCSSPVPDDVSSVFIIQSSRGKSLEVRLFLRHQQYSFLWPPSLVKPHHLGLWFLFLTSLKWPGKL